MQHGIDGSTATRRLAAFAASLRYEDLPAQVIAHVKNILLDSLGCALAANTLGAGCREVVSIMQKLGGAPESSILGHAARIAAPNAAFANGALVHALNYDPIGPEVGHVGVVALTAPLAAAEAAGPVPGRSFLAAAAVAAEITARVTAAAMRAGQHASDKVLNGQFLGYFGAAAGAGRVLGLDADRMHSAFGLALMQASGSMQIVLEGDPPAKAIYGAFPNHGGVLAALLARGGLGAACDALEGKAGLYGLAYGGAYEPRALTEGLGAEFLLLGTQFKPWPTSMIVHPFIEAGLELARQDVRTADIEAVEIVGPGHIRPWCEPLDDRRRPKNPATAANSIPFGVAKALARGEVALADFTRDGLDDRVARSVAERTGYALNDGMHGAIVRILTTDGRRLESHVETPLGHPSRPVPFDRLVAKFRDCCRYAAPPLSPARADDLLDLLMRLETVDDVGVVAQIAAGSSGIRGC
jgi:2-methylcitrate dehydratase PrpD